MQAKEKIVSKDKKVSIKEDLEYFEGVIRILYENSVKKITIGDINIEFYDTGNKGCDDFFEEDEKIIN